jgi:hypothetical protein
MSCNPKNSEQGNDGKCYAYCPQGWTAIDNGPICAQNCPPGFAATGSTDSSVYACVKPTFLREAKPMLQCPAGADRLFETCLLDCPIGTKKKFNLCVPDCPPNYVESKDGLSCQAEFIKRVATVREACYANESRIAGRICLAPCDAGTLPSETNPELCFATVPINLRPYFWTGDPQFASNTGSLVSKVIFARQQSAAVCSALYEPLNGVCLATCPTGSIGLGTECVALCPPNFKNVKNQNSCLRPLQKRRVVESTLEEVFGGIKRVLLLIIIIIGVSMLGSLL